MTFNISIYNKGNKYKLIDSGTKKADFTDFEFAFEKKLSFNLNQIIESINSKEQFIEYLKEIKRFMMRTMINLKLNEVYFNN
jgi:hypothetical protein